MKRTDGRGTSYFETFEYDNTTSDRLAYLDKNGNRYEERPIRIAKRSESISIIQSGVKENEIVALADPTTKPGDKSGLLARLCT